MTEREDYQTDIDEFKAQKKRLLVKTKFGKSKLKRPPIYSVVIGNSIGDNSLRNVRHADEPNFWKTKVDLHLPLMLIYGVKEMQFKLPFGTINGKGYTMPFFQRRDARLGVEGVHPPLPYLADRLEFETAMGRIREAGISVLCYVGSPKHVYEPTEQGGWQRWQETILDEVSPILQTCDSIGLDAFFDFPEHDGHRMRLVRNIEFGKGQCRCEPYPLADQPWAFGHRWVCSSRFYYNHLVWDRQKPEADRKWASEDPSDLVVGLLQAHLHQPDRTLQELALEAEANGNRPMVSSFRFDQVLY